MNRYGIEDIGKAVQESIICPFMLERECSTLAETDCVRCVKIWFAEHDKQIRDEVIEKFVEHVEKENINIYEQPINCVRKVAMQMKGEQNE